LVIILKKIFNRGSKTNCHGLQAVDNIKKLIGFSQNIFGLSFKGFINWYPSYKIFLAKATYYVTQFHGL